MNPTNRLTSKQLLALRKSPEERANARLTEAFINFRARPSATHYLYLIAAMDEHQDDYNDHYGD